MFSLFTLFVSILTFLDIFKTILAKDQIYNPIPIKFGALALIIQISFGLIKKSFTFDYHFNISLVNQKQKIH